MGRLKEASAVWEKGLSVLEAELATKPSSLPLQLAVADQQARIGFNYLSLGMWAEGLRCYRRAFEVHTPTRFIHWLRYALLLDETGDHRGVVELARAAVAHHPISEDLQDQVAHAWLILFEPSDDPRWPAKVRSLAESFAAPGWGQWDRWVRAFARIRLGEAEVGIDALAQIPDTYGRWPAIALAQHRLGHKDAARRALSLAEETAEHHFWNTDLSRPLVEQRDGWVQLRALRRQAQRLIANKSLQDSPAERMFRGRVLYALGEEQRAEAELAAAIGVRPNDPEPWLARSRIYAKLGRMDRASADRLKAQDLKGSDPQQIWTWIETGRLLAEMGEQGQADRAFTRALALGNGVLYPFLESGWWVVGPYPPDFELSCAPEIDPDPSRPVAAVDGRSDLRWSSTSSQRGVGGIDVGSVPAANGAASLYLLSYVYADRPREAVLNLIARGDVRLWVNGHPAFDGYAAWHLQPGSLTRIPASLTAGRNTILIKYRPAEDIKSIQCRFDDTPVEQADDLAIHEKSQKLRAELENTDGSARLVIEEPERPWHWVDRGRRFGELGRWDEAARAFYAQKAVELAPKDQQVWKARGQVLAGLGRWDDAAADLVRALDLTAEPKGEFPYYPWRGGRGEVDALIARSDELHGRVARQRPRDRTLSARRTEFLAEAGRWPEAEAERLHDHFERFPDDWWAPGLLAKRLLDRGELSEYRTVCRQALDRFGGRTEHLLLINLARAALIAPSGFEDHPLVRKLIADADGQPVPEFWLQSTAALAELRRNDASAALERLDARVFPLADYPNSRAMADAIRALTCQTAGRTDQAQAALGRVQAALEAHRRRPDLGPEAWDWHNWTQVEVLARQAARVIPSIPATAAAVSLAREQAVRGEREARAGRVATRMALVRIGMDLGANDEVLAAVKDILAERTRIAAEEPANSGYLADLAETQTMLGRLIALPPQVVPLVPTSAQKPGIWRFTTAKPPEGWTQPNFDDSGWQQGPGGFGAMNDPAYAVHTTWNTPEIWIRRTVEIPSSLKPIRLRFEACHDDDLEVSLDGVPAARWAGYSGSYAAIEVPVEELRPIKSGGDRLVMAAHCRNTGGPQGLDVGVAAITIGGIKLEEGIEGLRRGVDLAEKLPPSDPRRRRIRRDAAEAHLEIGEMLQKAGRTAEAERAFREAKGLVATVATNDPRQLAADRLVLVVSSAWLGEQEAAQTACREVAGAIEPAGDNSELVRLVRKAVRAVGIDRPEASELLAAAAGEPPAALNDAVRRDPKSARAHRARANWFGRHGSWKKAAKDLAEANRLEPDPWTALDLGAVLVHLGEVERYRELCRAMMSQSAGTPSNMNAERTAKLCLYPAPILG